MNWTHRLMHHWNLQRILRLVVGAAILGSGWNTGEMAVVALGGALIGTGLLNFGCGDTCASGACSTHAAKMVQKSTDTQSSEI
ncbi:hypothetical protein [Pontibacter sp. G13]|uniref:hypothetical protein n=1 Tax=Pontibacter sp. G13 TaxID=3074898 RepID=UPI00288B9CB4|nr:hypothetical protein [Pontibacter sp. G13]WNJ16413.1 hypothetical protein RJD25_16230 [Pontibacter sp. G13]